jgi:hypothetical protein
MKEYSWTSKESGEEASKSLGFWDIGAGETNSSPDNIAYNTLKHGQNTLQHRPFRGIEKEKRACWRLLPMKTSPP